MRKQLLVTWVTHNSRYNERMKSLKLEKWDWYFFGNKDRVLIYNLIFDKIEELGIKNFTLNVLSDHVHIVIIYEEKNLSKLIKNIKWTVSFNYSKLKECSKKWEWAQSKIWAKWYSITYLDTEEYYNKAIEYTINNHDKHWIKSIYQLVNRGF